MCSEVPHPMIATRAPGAGSTGAASFAVSSARVQHSGWLAISASTWLLPAALRALLLWCVHCGFSALEACTISALVPVQRRAGRGVEQVDVLRFGW